MTTEHGFPEPHQYRWSRWWPFEFRTGRDNRPGATTPITPEMAGQEPPTAAAPAGDGADSVGGDGTAVTGNVVSGEDAPPADRDGTPPVPLHQQYPPAVLAARRAQIAEFAEFAHRSRVPSLTDLQALGSGGGITAAVIKAMAAAIIDKPPVAGLTTDLPELTAVLMRALVEPAEPEKLTEAQAECFVSVHGRLVLNGWLVDASGRQPATSLVWPDTQPGQPELVVDAAQPEVEPVVEAAQPEQSEPLVDGAQPEQNEPVVDAAQPETASTAGPCALLIAGSARSLAGDRPCLTLDDLMAYARREAFRLSGGIRAARNLEIVVLLDQSLGGGIWVDADPDKGHPVAALAVSVPDPPAGIRFTHVPLAGPVPRLMLSAGRAGQ